MKKILLLALLCASPIASAFDPECDKVIRLDAAMKVLPGEWRLLKLKSAPPPAPGDFTCSYMPKGKEMMSLALSVSRVRALPGRGKVEALKGIGESAEFYVEQRSGKGWQGLTERGVNVLSKGQLYQLRIQRDGGDEAAMREYLIETIRVAVGP